MFSAGCLHIYRLAVITYDVCGMELHEKFTPYHEQGSWKTASFDVTGLNDGRLTLNSLFNCKKDIGKYKNINDLSLDEKRISCCNIRLMG